MMKLKLAILITCVALTGCASFNTIKTENHVPIGQEMIDLKKAKESGIITESQYNEQIEMLLKRQKLETQLKK